MAILVTPFIGDRPNKVVKWTNDELEKDRDFVQKGEGAKHCFRGRLYMLKAAGKLAAETVIDALTVTAFTIAGPFVRIPAVFCSKKDKLQDCIAKTEPLKALNVLKLALRTLAVAAAAFATFIVGVFFSANTAIKIQELLGILEKKKEVKKEEAKEIEKTVAEPLVENKEQKQEEVKEAEKKVGEPLIENKP